VTEDPEKASFVGLWDDEVDGTLDREVWHANHWMMMDGDDDV
jgi:hypothetical protein